jgi:hypothetical protein
MWYGGNHIESWAASGLTNQYGDGSNMYSDTLPNEPKKSHLAAMHSALAKMNDVLLSDAIQSRSSASAVAPCAVDPEAAPAPGNVYLINLRSRFNDRNEIHSLTVNEENEWAI